MFDNQRIKKIFNKIKNKNILTYGENSNANFRVSNIRFKFNYTVFDLDYKSQERKKININNIYLKLLGRHNVLNAVAAIVICLNIGVSTRIIKSSLKKLSGVQRRMTKYSQK